MITIKLIDGMALDKEQRDAIIKSMVNVQSVEIKFVGFVHMLDDEEMQITPKRLIIDTGDLKFGL